MPSLDFTKAIDFTARRGASKSDLNTMQTALEPEATKGLVIIQPTEPDVTTYPKLVRYVWIDTSAEPYVAKVYSPILASWAPGAVGAGTITTALIADGAVITSKLAPLAVDATKLADESVVNSKLGPGSVSEGKIAANAVVSSVIKNENVITDKLANMAVTTPKIGLLQVTLELLATNSVDASKIMTDAVETAKIKDLAVTNAKVADNSVLPIKLDVAAFTDGLFAVKKSGANEIDFVAPMLHYSSGPIADWYDPSDTTQPLLSTWKGTPFPHLLGGMPDHFSVWLEVKANTMGHNFDNGWRIPFSSLMGESAYRHGGYQPLMNGTHLDFQWAGHKFQNWSLLIEDTGTRTTARGYSTLGAGTKTYILDDFDLVMVASRRYNA